MKLLLLYAFLHLISVSSFAQEGGTISRAQKNYFQKSKTQRKVAQILLGSGIGTLSITALIAVLQNAFDNSFDNAGGYFGRSSNEPEKHSYTVPIVASFAALIASISLFEAAKNNRFKAARMSLILKYENASSMQWLTLHHFTYPALTLKVHLP